MYVIPAVDVLEGRVVRLRQGSYEDVTVYADDPLEILESWVEQGAKIVHVVDLAGVRSVADAEQLIESGAQRAVLGTAAVWESGVVANIVGSVGSDAVVAAVDVHDGLATGAGWRDEGRDVAAVMRDLVAVGVVRALVTGIAGDGMLTGPDTALIETVRSVAPNMALIASGGVGALDDIAVVKAADVEAVIVGRALYDGRFTFADAAAAAAD